MAELASKWKFSTGWVGQKPKEYPDWFLNILAARGIKDKSEIEPFLRPKYDDLFDPSCFQNMVEAVELLARAKDEKWGVTVYGDYDVDGVTSTALVFEVLSKIGVQNVSTYIPHRVEEGYGLNQESLAEIQESGTKLVVVVDSGITATKIIDDPKNSELEFLVIDHHEISAEKMPKRAVVLHPELTRKGTQPQHLSAAGMAFYLAQALQQRFKTEFLEGQEKWLLDLVALSTIADVMPLAGQNRILAKYGLTVLAKTKRPGIKELAKVSSIDPEEITAYSVGFLLGPRLNAAGRLETANVALDLLLTKDPKGAKKLAEELNRLNTERQQLCERILEEAKAEIATSSNKDAEIYLLSNKNWPRGVVGIIAGRLAETYARPVIIFENDGEFHHGSARSVGDFDITAALAQCEDCIEKFGGHAKAAGLTVKADKFVVFSDKILKITKNSINKADLSPELSVDTEIKETDIINEAVDLINLLEPFGYGNVTPILALKNVKVENSKLVGAEHNHLKFQLAGSGASAIAFNRTEKIDENLSYDMVFNLRYNYWNNRKTIDLRIIDIKETKGA